MLTRIVVDGRKILCSTCTEAELREMYDGVREQAELTGAPPRANPESLLFHYETVGPIEVHYRERTYVLWGSPTELRFYAPEEFEVLREG